MTRPRRITPTEGDTLRTICDFLDLRMAQGELVYIRHNPSTVISKVVKGKIKTAFKKVRQSQLGASDLIVFQRCDSGGYGKDGVWHNHIIVLCIEVKSSKGHWSEWQLNWSLLAKAQGCRYIVARSLEDVIKELK